MRKSILSILIERDGMSQNDAKALITDATEDLNERLADGEIPYDICNEWFGLEPDYLDGLI